jgi:hypothetical protein
MTGNEYLPQLGLLLNRQQFDLDHFNIDQLFD